MFLLLSIVMLLFCVQIHLEAKLEEEKEKELKAHAMKHHRGGEDSRRKKPKEKLDARKLQVFLREREKSKDSGVSRIVWT